MGLNKTVCKACQLEVMGFWLSEDDEGWENGVMVCPFGEEEHEIAEGAPDYCLHPQAHNGCLAVEDEQKCR